MAKRKTNNQDKKPLTDANEIDFAGAEEILPEAIEEAAAEIIKRRRGS